MSPQMNWRNTNKPRCVGDPLFGAPSRVSKPPCASKPKALPGRSLLQLEFALGKTCGGPAVELGQREIDVRVRGRQQIREAAAGAVGVVDELLRLAHHGRRDRVGQGGKRPDLSRRTAHRRTRATAEKMCSCAPDRAGLVTSACVAAVMPAGVSSAPVATLSSKALLGAEPVSPYAKIEASS